MQLLLSLLGALQASQLASTRPAARPDSVATAVPVAGASVAAAVRATQAPTIDGRDDDPAWRTAQAIGAFRQFDPVEDGAPKFRTEAKVAYDERNLYVFVRMYDPHPDSIVSLLSRRDVKTPSDQVKVMIDSYHDRRTGYELAVNPAGVKRDYYTFNDSEEDASWDAVWDVATRIDSLGWTAEYRIPLSQLRYADAPEHTFGFSVVRDIARFNERDSWPVYRRSRAGISSQLGEVTGLVGLASPRRLEAAPYVVTKNVTDPASLAFARRQELSAGADVKYGLTSNLTVDAAINPDFGQVEADPAELNLSGFETLFREKRPFFLEGTGIFRFDLNCNDGICNGLFYSRRIGRGPQLTPVRDDEDSLAVAPSVTTILGAAKLTGRLSRGTSIGVLDAVTQREKGTGPTIGARTVEPGTNYLVGRLQQDFRNGESGLGVMVTGVNRRLDEWSQDYLRRNAYTGGVDFRHRFAQSRYELSGYATGSYVSGTPAAIARTQRNSGVSGAAIRYYQRPDDRLAYDTTRTSLAGDGEQLSISKIGGGVVRFNTAYQRFSPGFEINDVGFLRKVNQQGLYNWVGIQPNKPKWFYRRAFLNFNQWTQATADGMLTDLGGNVNAHAEFRNSWWGHLGIGTERRGNSLCDFCARGGPAIRTTPGVFGWAGVEVDPRRTVAPAVFADYERHDYGRSSTLNLNPQVAVRVSSNLSATVGPSYQRLIDDWKWYDNYGDPGKDTATFARLDRTTFRLTSRLDFTATPTLSFQFYGEPFVTSGRYNNWKQLNEPRSRSYAQRFKPYVPPKDTVQTTPNVVLEDAHSLDDFNFKSFRSNAVLRWEYRPGSTLFVVWQQERSQDGRDPGTFELRRDLGHLFGERPDNTLLIKTSYWFSF
jgi:Domain of unknown function (DUF5916)/Carbohydrate family 9 binding domain-like